MIPVRWFKGAVQGGPARRDDRRRAPFDPRPLLFPAQIAAVYDPARWQAWPGGRQGGKTDGLEKLLLRVASERKGQLAIYVSTSKKRAVATIWDELVTLNADCGLGGRARGHTLRFPGAGALVVTGVENRRMANDLRGRKKVALYCLDEAQDWPDELLRYFYEAVVFPSLSAVGGAVVVAGTGGPPRGFWHEVATSKPEWSRHRFTPLGNPFLVAGEARRLIDKACADRGVDESDPSIRREFFAEFVNDANRQIFPVSDANLYDAGERPAGKWSFVIASDFGTVDAAAVVVWGWTSASPHLWVIETEKQHALGASAQVALVRAVAARYSGRGLVGIVGDPGGGGAGLMVDLRQEHLIGMEAAEKAGKAAACIVLRDGLRSGKVKIPRAEREFVEELRTPEWDPDAIGSVIRGHMPDRVDAALYGYRKAVGMHHWKAPATEPQKSDLHKELERKLS